MASVTPYGYLKDENDGNHWIVDEEAAEIVRLIFKWTIDGLGPYQIAKLLQEKKVEIPAVHMARFGQGNNRNKKVKDPYGWGSSTVVGILKKREYLGHTVNFKTQKHFKDKKSHYVSEDNWVIFENAVTPDVLAKVSAEFFDEFNKRYGSHIHILDWALHLDEATPHIHERHVFDAKNKYGELCPQQDKALEELGFELPDPAKKKGKYNNRKMNFDAECRKLFLEIAQRNGVQVECEPVYGGAGYLEKQDFIIENQKKRIAEKQAVLDEITMRVLDMENFVEQVAEDAYEKACEAVSDTMAEQTRAEDIEELRRYKKWLTSDERKTPKDKRDFVGRCLDNLENRLRGMAQKVAGKVMETLQNPRIKEQKKSEVKEHARKSVRALLEANRKLVEEQRAKVAETPAHKKARGEELG